MVHKKMKYFMTLLRRVPLVKFLIMRRAREGGGEDERGNRDDGVISEHGPFTTLLTSH
jgi:hypothetical protein